MLAENLEDALELYADMICRPILAGKGMEAGRQVLLQEFLPWNDDPESRFWKSAGGTVLRSRMGTRCRWGAGRY